MLRLTLRIITAFVASIALGLWVIQHSSALQDTVGNQIIQFIEESWSARISSSKPRINFFTFSVYLEKGTITPADNKQFSWSFDACHVHVSPIALLLQRAAHLYITFNNIKASTRATDDKIDLLEHIQAIFEPTTFDVDIEPKALTINNIDLTIAYNDRVITCQTPGTFYIANNNNYGRFKEETWHGSLFLDQALLKLANTPYAYGTKGRVDFQRNKHDGTWRFSTKLVSKLPVIDPIPHYTVEGNWNAQGGELLLTDGEEKTRLACTFSYPLTIGLKGSFPVNHVKTAATLLASNTKNVNPLGGTCHVDVVLLPDKQGVRSSGSVDIFDMNIANATCQHLGINLQPSTHHITGVIALDQSSAYSMAGSLSWDWKLAQGSLTLTNTRQLLAPTTTNSPSTYSIEPNNCHVAITCNTKGLCKGSYDCSITNAIYKKTSNHQGILAFKNNRIAVKGHDEHGSYRAKATFDPHFYIKRLHYATKNGTPILSCTTAGVDPFLLHGSVSWQFVKKFLDQQTRRMIFSNQSSFALSLNQQDLKAIKADIALERGSFYMPEYQNLLQKCAASITLHPEERRIEIDHCSIGMSKGSITCPHAVLKLDENNNIQHLMAPLCIDNLFINWKKDFYGFVCGTLALDKTEDTPTTIAGTLVLKKSILKDAFLRGESTSSFDSPTGNFAQQIPFPLNIDLRLVTEKPIKVNTGSFNAQANIDLRIISAAQKDFFASPIVTGSINLEKGALHILNQSLNIQYGKIQFLHNNFSDPLVDLIARNRIGKYLVTLQANGSLQKPTISLESTPALSEEQIIGLLLTGSEQSTLQADLPAMLLQNLDVLIFSNKKDTKGHLFRDTLTKTFKYVQITPNLDASKTGRGALKGSLSLNFTKQLRGKIETDLDTQNNVTGQIEYLLSDNLNLKFVQEQRGERGVELEFQVKL